MITSPPARSSRTAPYGQISAPAARPALVLQDHFLHVCFPVEQLMKTDAEDDAQVLTVLGCTARGAVAYTWRHVLTDLPALIEN